MIVRRTFRYRLYPTPAQAEIRLSDICVPEPPPIAEKWAWEIANFPPLKPLGKPCHDCAVTCGLYLPFAEELAHQPRDVIEAASLRWFCHNNPTRACRGNLDFQRAAQSSQTPTSQGDAEGGVLGNSGNPS